MGAVFGARSLPPAGVLPAPHCGPHPSRKGSGEAYVRRFWRRSQGRADGEEHPCARLEHDDGVEVDRHGCPLSLPRELDAIRSGALRNPWEGELPERAERESLLRELLAERGLEAHDPGCARISRPGGGPIG